MIASISLIIVLLFGILVAAVCLWALMAPERMIKFTRGVWDQDIGMTLAVSVRVLLGLALLGAAAASSLTNLFYALGVLSLVAAAVVPFVGRGRIDQLLDRLESVSNPLIQCWAVFGVGFGALLIYGAV